MLERLSELSFRLNIRCTGRCPDASHGDDSGPAFNWETVDLVLDSQNATGSYKTHLLASQEEI